MKMTDRELANELAPKVNDLLMGFTDVIMKHDPHPAALFSALTQLFVSAVAVSGNDIRKMREAFNENIDAIINNAERSKH